MANINLQQRYSEIKELLEADKISLVRVEANLEQKEKEKAQVLDELVKIAGTDDEDIIKDTIDQIENKLAELIEEASEILKKTVDTLTESDDDDS